MRCILKGLGITGDLFTLEVTTVSRKAIEPITQPNEPIESLKELDDALRTAASLLRNNDRTEATRARRKAKADALADEKLAKTNETLLPLLERIFAYAHQHWDELAPSHSPETFKTNVAEFKRHIDTIGTKSVDEAQVIAYIETIETSEMIAVLRKVLGDEVTDDLVTRIKSLVTSKTTKVLDSITLKSIVQEQPLLEVPGFGVTYSSTLKLALKRSAVQQRRKKPAITEVRALPNS